MRTPTYLHFPLDEFRARLDGLRGPDGDSRPPTRSSCTAPENIYYLSGYQTPGFYLSLALIVPLERGPHPHPARPREVSRARVLDLRGLSPLPRHARLDRHHTGTRSSTLGSAPSASAWSADPGS